MSVAVVDAFNFTADANYQNPVYLDNPRYDDGEFMWVVAGNLGGGTCWIHVWHDGAWTNLRDLDGGVINTNVLLAKPLSILAERVSFSLSGSTTPNLYVSLYHKGRR